MRQWEIQVKGALIKRKLLDIKRYPHQKKPGERIIFEKSTYQWTCEKELLYKEREGALIRK